MDNSKQQKTKKKTWFKKLSNKYRLIFLNEKTYEERFSLRLSRLNVIVLTVFFILSIAFGTFLLISRTTLKAYIPGYTEVSFRQDMYKLLQRTDSLERVISQRETYLKNIRMILSDSSAIEALYSVDSVNKESTEDTSHYQNISFMHSKEDSLLRKEYEEDSRYNLKFRQSENLYDNFTSESGILLFPPVDGTVTSNFDPINKHFGVDLVTGDNEPVLATLDGTVILSNWTTETGYVIAIQHRHDLISVYKHNAVLLKKQGDFVVAGEAIAIVGESGEISTGPHLHFEIWYRGNPMNPNNFLRF
ncbi:MAG: M23 family metallopeptidase [Bacteroidales bacterium]|nr:M23 family metallopeptidase [Bacteroidales bacterium]MDD3011238.1 M23 family metallopeptidase [Bacteroidales bacterium]MDY0284934.1 M23 family metallopeptidase [Bacteroidales bacterium]HPE85900.1 M23 family metallopeptidase [Bacteroidales bacterium]